MTYEANNIDVSWQPVTSWASNFKSHELVREEPNKLEFLPTATTKIFFILFVLMPFIAFVMFSYGWFIGIAPFYTVVIGVIAAGAFTLAARTIASMAFAQKIFDLNNRYYYATEKSILGNVTETKQALSEIVALQLLTKEIQDSDSNNYNAYELNLVLKNGTRQNVICHGHYQSLKKDSATLSSYLGVPVLIGEA